jgi:xanthine dehydrogenase YagS FAD-binding subunit
MSDEVSMQAFEWVDATSVEHAATLLAKNSPDRPVVAKAGGMDLVDLMKEGLVRPAQVVNLKSIRGLNDIAETDGGGLTLGALVTLSQIERAAAVRTRFPALAEAAGHAATPQVRNAATIGGNLLQRPRCWYFRSAHFHQNGFDPERAAVEGDNQYHAIFDTATSPMVHASTPATALMAYGAEVVLTNRRRESRNVRLKDFLLPPNAARECDAAIEPGEILTEVRIPPVNAGTRAAYHKQTERDSYDWPICDVAVVLQMNGTVVNEAAIVLGWVAPTPRRALECEAVLRGTTVTEDLAREAARAAVVEATPLSRNAYKVPVLEAVVRRTILAAATAQV